MARKRRCPERAITSCGNPLTPYCRETLRGHVPTAGRDEAVGLARDRGHSHTCDLGAGKVIVREGSSNDESIGRGRFLVKLDGGAASGFKIIRAKRRIRIIWSASAQSERVEGGDLPRPQG